jgi:glycerol-3-phosphate acyltransferase PlsY
MITSILIVLFAYLSGSISTAVWYGRIIHRVDIRNHGSGNAGATNSLRVLGKKAGVIVLIVDFLKGVLPILLARYLGFDELVILLAGLAAVMGHLLPIFSNFQGGKGVATSMGVIIGIFPIGALACFLVFLIVVLLTKYVSLGSILGAIAFPVAVALSPKADSLLLIIFGISLALLLAFTHRKNIERLLSGTESKLGKSV